MRIGGRMWVIRGWLGARKLQVTVIDPWGPSEEPTRIAHWQTGTHCLL